ncbi:MAG TPA: PilW family protein [Steroidobacteraceae bacterium]|nr:PilW family protein [Steroidobacteraceae bacterium]
MSPAHPTMLAPARAQRGFTIVELMVTIAIAMFLLGGLVTVVQNVRNTYTQQQALVQLQDQQRFAITLLTDVIQNGGYFDNPTGDTVVSALPLDVGDGFPTGQAFTGLQGGAGPAAAADTLDTVSVRYRTAPGDQIINCSGSSNTTGVEHVYINTFSVLGGVLQCQLITDGVAGPALPLVSGVASLTIYYGVKRLTPATDYNVDTYLQANAMQASDWSNISSVRVRVWFVNPLFGAPGRAGVAQPQYIAYERVIEVMSRAGDYT